MTKLIKGFGAGRQLDEESLVFAPVIRVSTEGQAQRGESLRTQKADLTRDIEALGGSIYRWYAGQEHATPEYERIILEQAVTDLQAGKCNAIIVHDLSRWSRDNEKSKAYLRIFKKHNIRFFERTREINLFDPTQYFVLGMGVEVGEFFAGQQAYKSITNRIARAKRGLPAAGNLPYGRIWNPDSQTWSIDPEKQAIVEEVARLYLNENLSWNELGPRFGMNASNLCKIMTKRCREEWEQRFILKRWGIDETVITKIPRLLPEEVIKAIVEKSGNRRTWDKKAQIHKYLFAKLIFDMDTGKALTGTANSMGKRYYKPYHGGKIYRYQVNAEILEEAVVYELFQALGSLEELREAVFEGNSNTKVITELMDSKAGKESELKRVETNLEKFVTAINNCPGDIEAFIQRITPKVRELETRAKTLKEEITSISTQIATIPSDKEIEQSRVMAIKDVKRKLFNEGLLKRTEETYLNSGQALFDLPFEEQRKIIGIFFGGKDRAGKRYGVYVKYLGGKPRRYRFEAYGKIGIVEGEFTSRSSEYKSEFFPDGSPSQGEISGIAEAITKEKEKDSISGERQEYILSPSRIINFRLRGEVSAQQKLIVNE